jgi:ATP/maltotriose-dependent transcriptional regulator MalT
MFTMGDVTTAAQAPLLALKLAVPPPRDDELQRERLLARISGPSIRLCAVVAPARLGQDTAAGSVGRPCAGQGSGRMVEPRRGR